MFESIAEPLIIFSTRTNTELGAQKLSVDEEGFIILEGVVKKVTESMLTSFPLHMLGRWTTNRISIRYPREEITQRRVKKFGSAEELDLEGILALAN